MGKPTASPFAQLSTLLVSLLIFFIPANWFLKGWEETAFVRGLFVDYLLPKLYVTDLILLALIGIAGWLTWQHRPFKITRQWRNRWLLWGFGVVVFVTSQLWISPVPATLWFMAKLALVLAGGWALSTLWPRLNQSVIMTAIASTILFQSGVALYQHWAQHSLAGYWLLGEPALPSAIGLAASTINGVIRILPYGTTAHPNILGGVLALYMLMLLPWLLKLWRQLYDRKANWLVVASYGLPLVLGLWTILLTHSLSALITLGIGLLVLGWRMLNPHFGEHTVQRLLIGVCIVGGLIAAPAVVFGVRNSYADVTSISRRAFLNQAALGMIVTHPITGIGVNAFTINLEEYALTPEVVRFIQPAHHVPLLWWAETGLIGSSLVLFTFWLWLKWFHNTNWVWAVLVLTPALAFDHYLLTLNTGLLLGVVWLVSQMRNQKSKGQRG